MSVQTDNTTGGNRLKVMGTKCFASEHHVATLVCFTAQVLWYRDFYGDVHSFSIRATKTMRWTRRRCDVVARKRACNLGSKSARSSCSNAEMSPRQKKPRRMTLTTWPKISPYPGDYPVRRYLPEFAYESLWVAYDQL